MKINLPESIADITLEQYQKYIALTKREGLDERNFNRRLIVIFTELKYREVEKIPLKDYDFIINQINTALSQDVKFQDRFFINGVEFGFIPNLDEITTAEYVDLNTHGVEIETLHKVMAVLFRPIKNTDILGNYSIESYQGTKQYSDIMKYTPLSIVNGALVFFWSLSRELRNHIQKSTEAVQEKVNELRTTLKSGDGTQQSAS